MEADGAGLGCKVWQASRSSRQGAVTTSRQEGAEEKEQRCNSSEDGALGIGEELQLTFSLLPVCELLAREVIYHFRRSFCILPHVQVYARTQSCCCQDELETVLPVIIGSTR